MLETLTIDELVEIDRALNAQQIELTNICYREGEKTSNWESLKQRLDDTLKAQSVIQKYISTVAK